MRLIREITDKDILGTDGLSKAKPRLAARAIIKNDEGLYAIMYAEKFGLYSFPGGGIDNGEDKLAALKREIREETGCVCDTVEELGCIYENRAHCDFTQYSYYYFVTTSGVSQDTQLTDEEIAEGTVVQWLTLDETKRLITDTIYDTNQRKFVRARDTAVLNEYIKRYVERS